MLQSIFQSIIVYLHHNPHSAGLITFFLVFGEAMAVIGTIFPGSVTMSAVGVLIGSGVIPAAATLTWAVAGAISGDTLSYLIGYVFKDHLRGLWPFTKHPEWLAKGERFFTSHGGKSVIIGRFFGPMRSMVPLVAGMLRMSPIRFLLAAIPSASIWAVAYMIPGILLGALSLELPPGIALEFVGIVLLILTAILVVTWLLKYSISHFAKQIDKELRHTWDFLREHRTSHWITRLLTNPHYPGNHRQLMLSFYALMTTLLFLLVMTNAFTHGVLTYLNAPLYHLLRNLRNTYVDDAMLIFTILGSWITMIIIGGVIFVWFVFNRKIRAALHWGGAILLSCAVTSACKAFFYSPRPGHLLHGPTTSSFPSGHTTLSVTIFGYLAILIAHELTKENRKFVYLIAGALAGLVGFSRLFLGAHWLTDVIGGVLLGISSILITTTSYHRSRTHSLGRKRTIVVSCIAIIVVWIFASFVFFKKYNYNYTLTWPKYIITRKNLRDNQIKHLPLFRENRLGHAKEVFNLLWATKLDRIKRDLTKHNWQQHAPCLSPRGLLYRLSTKGTDYRLPLLPQLYQNKCPVLLMTKQLPDKKHSVSIRFWRSSFSLKDNTTPLWLGIIKYQQNPHKLLITYKLYKITRFFFGATKELVPDLRGYAWHLFVFPKNKQPKRMQKLHWDGKVLLIK